MKLIFDCGSSKCTIVQLDSNGIFHNKIEVDGFNPMLHDNHRGATLNHFKSVIPKSFIDALSITYGGAGCIGQPINTEVKKGLQRIFVNADIGVYSDLDFIGNALDIKGQSIIAILGTGSNAGVWNGKTIVTSTPSGGYLLGDEGSAFQIGKQLVINYIRNNFNEATDKILKSKMELGKEQIIPTIYSSDTPNKLIASFASVISDLDDPLVEKIKLNTFKSFIDTRIIPLSKNAKIIHFFGSVAYFNMDYLKPLLEEVNLQIGMVSKGPLDMIMP